MEITLNCQKYLIKLNKIEIFKNLLDFNLGSVLTEIVDVEESIELKAFLLIFNSSRITNKQLSVAYGQKEINESYDLVILAKSFEQEYKNFLLQEVTIKKDFFDNIIKADNGYLTSLFNLFEKFYYQLNIKLPKDIRIKYYIHYRENLKEEFQNNKERYEELVEFFENPILGQNEILYELLDNYNSYKSNYIKPLQEKSDKKETLEDLYIEPFFSVHKNNFLNIPEGKEYNDFHQYSDKINIHEFFSNYFLLNNTDETLKENYDMVFVLGQPGQGKTSFCYKLIYDYIESSSDLPSIPIVFEKIRDFVAKDFINDPFGKISEKHKYLDFQEDEMILVLDGLDESYMSGGISNEDLRNFYERLKKRSNRNIKIILTSRFNFLNVNDACLDKTLVLHINELTDNQIEEYCKKFEKFYPENSLVKNIKSILKTEKYDHIKELLRQAVLIYFIAISNIEIDEKDSKSRIYDKIFDSLAQRSWDSNGQLDYINVKLKNNPTLYKNYLREFIRNIAFEIYHSPKLYITVNKLLELDSTKLFIKRCFNDEAQDTKEKITEFSKYLLISFYFQQTNKDNEDSALEFFHNSLWEFLTAEYIWEENKNLLLRRDKYEEFVDIKDEQYFDFINRIVGEKKIDHFSIKRNLLEIIENETEEVKSQMFAQSINLFYRLLGKDFLISFQIQPNGLTSLEKGYESFNLLWCFIHECNKDVLINFYEKDCYYLFHNRLYMENINNIKIFNSALTYKFLIESNLNNVHFEKGVGILELDSCRLNNVYFKDIHITRSLFDNNNFDNSEFINSEFSHYVDFENNKFHQLVMNNVCIMHESWFYEFIENNSFDDDFKDQHFIEKRMEKNHALEDVERIYIMCKNLIDKE